MKVNKYFTEPIMCGGLPTTRGELIAEMQEQGVSRDRIDYYLMGLDHSIERSAEGR